MKNVQRIIKKEMDKIFKFPRILFSTIILPGLLIFGIYAFMGMSIKSEVDKTVDYKSNIYFVNSPQSFDDFVNNYSKVLNVTEDDRKLDDLLVDVKAGGIDAVVYFSTNFENQYFDDATITLYSNVGLSNSNTAEALMKEIISQYKQKELEKEEINTNIFSLVSENNITDEDKNSGQILAMLLPMFIMTFVFAGALSIGADAIAGEKERGTLATLLMAPIKRNDIIIGKIISTALIAILSAVSSFIGIMASLPFSKELFPIGSNLNYNIVHYLQILVILIVLGLLASGLILIASTFGKSTKEATSYAMPLYIVAILASTISMFNTELPDNIALYFVPIYNITLALKGIFTFELDMVHYLFVLGSNIIYIAAIIFLLMKMFKSEQVLFNK